LGRDQLIKTFDGNGNLTIGDISISKHTLQEDILEFYPESVSLIKKLLWSIGTTELSSNSKIVQKILKNNQTQGNEGKAVDFSQLFKVIFDAHSNVFSSSESLRKIYIKVPLLETVQNTIFIDVPGVGGVDCLYDRMSKIHLDTSNIIIYVQDAEHINSKLSQTFGETLLIQKSKIVYVVNKIDRIKKEALEQIIQILGTRYKSTIYPVSALYALEVQALVNNQKTVDDVLDNSKVNLTQFLRLQSQDDDSPSAFKKRLIDYCNSIGSVTPLRDYLASLAKEENEKFINSNLKLIIGKHLDCIKKALNNPNGLQQYESLKKEVDSLQTIVDQIRVRLNEFMHYPSGRKINNIIRKSLKDLENTINNRLYELFDIRYSELENDVNTIINQTIVLFLWSSAETTIQESIDSYVTLNNGLLSNISSGIPQFQSISIAGKLQDSYYQILEQAIANISIIMNDTSDKPWFSFLRSNALKEYKSLKKSKFIFTWDDICSSVFNNARAHIQVEIQNSFNASCANLNTFLNEKIGLLCNCSSQLEEVKKSIDSQMASCLKAQQLLCQLQGEKS
jgi:ethanolamine utilization protein EutP (predicted NTPase)